MQKSRAAIFFLILAILLLKGQFVYSADELKPKDKTSNPSLSGASSKVAAEAASMDQGHSEGFQYNAKGKRDPFMPLVTGKSKLNIGLEGIEVADDIGLEGIVTDKKKGSFAIVNGTVVKENDVFGMVKILNINEKSIIISINDIEYEINLKKEGEEKIDKE